MISLYSNLVSPETISLTPLSSKTTTTKNTIKNDQRSPNYLALYGLRETPFAQEIDDRFFFLDTEQAQRLSLIHNLIQDPRMFLHLKGAPGVGKSSLISRFINIGEEDWRFSYFSANTMMNSEQLFFNISAGFGMSGLSENNNLKDICIKNILSLEISGVVPILVIDDVQELPVDTLKEIFELVNRWDKNHPKLRIILISDPSFDKTLKSEKIKPFRKLITHEIEVEPLLQEQIERYIYFRLMVAGLDGGNPITPEACSFILDKSKGLPEKINSLCHIALRDGMEEMTMKDFFDDHNFNFPLRKYLITGSLMAIFLGVLFSVVEPYSISDNQIRLLKKITMNNHSTSNNTAISSTSILANLSNEKIKPIKDTNVLDIEAIDKKAITVYDFSSMDSYLLNEISRKNLRAISKVVQLQKFNVKSTIETTLTTSTQTKLINNKQNQKTSKKNDELSKYTINKLTTITSIDFPEILSIALINPTSKSSEKEITIFGLGFNRNSKVTIYSEDGIKNISKNKVTFVADTQLNMKFIPENYTGKKWIVVTDPKNGKSNSILFKSNDFGTQSSNKQTVNKMKGEKWILSQNSDLYILLFMSSKDKKEIENLANSEKIEGQYAVFETKRNGVGWYHLILGTYENRDAAKLVIMGFPEQSDKPWIRPIKDVQKVIKKFSQKAL